MAEPRNLLLSRSGVRPGLNCFEFTDIAGAQSGLRNGGYARAKLGGTHCDIHTCGRHHKIGMSDSSDSRIANRVEPTLHQPLRKLVIGGLCRRHATRSLDESVEGQVENDLKWLRADGEQHIETRIPE
jgi:hypothetical protein